MKPLNVPLNLPLNCYFNFYKLGKGAHNLVRTLFDIVEVFPFDLPEETRRHFLV